MTKDDTWQKMNTIYINYNINSIDINNINKQKKGEKLKEDKQQDREDKDREFIGDRNSN